MLESCIISIWKIEWVGIRLFKIITYWALDIICPCWSSIAYINRIVIGVAVETYQSNIAIRNNIAMSIGKVFQAYVDVKLIAAPRIDNFYSL